MRMTIAAIAFLGLMAITALVPVYARQQANCERERPLVTIPEIKSQNGLLKGVVRLSDEERSFLSNDGRCVGQDLRYFKGSPLNKPWPSGGNALPDILPGPTLRARVGDLVQLAFLNQIDVRNFAFSLDAGERGDTTRSSSDGCDIATASRKNHPGQSAQIYPRNDNMPNCLHGSSTANIHFHGTHTTPSTTGDNVLLFVRPALRDNSGNIIGPKDEEVMQQFGEIWAACERNGPPKKWTDLPEAYRKDQERLLKLYDSTAVYNGVPGNLPESAKLWPKNKEKIDAGLWPQYSIGAYPYCYRLPQYPGSPPDTVLMGQAPGTHWYHAHKHGSTHLNVANGMAGAFIIEGDYDDALRKFYNTTRDTLKEQVLVIQQLETALNLMSPGKQGPAPLSVNGRRIPVVTMRPGEVQMWRVINAAARDFVQFQSFDRRGPDKSTIEWRQIAQDGVQFSYDNYQRFGTVNQPFNLAGANRADLLVKAPGHTADYHLLVVRSVSDLPSVPPGKLDTLLTVRVAGAPMASPMDFITKKEDFPKFPAYLADLQSWLPPRKTRNLVYNTTPQSGRTGGKMPLHVINGELFDGSVTKTMTLNTIEEWTVSNETVNIAHPFHIHINPFQIFEVFQPNKPRPSGCAALDPTNPDTWEPCKNDVLTPPYVWWDTFAIPTAKSIVLADSVCTEIGKCPPKIKNYTTCASGKCTVKVPGYFKMRSLFADFTGQYVNHCHILAHEDRGMMQLIEVEKKKISPYTHH